MDKRKKILKAALELITERGFHGAPMADIAAKAKVAAGTIYTYFESKDALIHALHRELEKNIFEVVQKEFPAAAPLRERYLFLFRTLIGYFLAHPRHFRYLEQYVNSPYGASLRRDRIMGITEEDTPMKKIFRQGLEAKVLKDFPLSVLASLTFGPLFFLVRDHTQGVIHLHETLIEQVAEACWDAVGLK